MTCHPISNTARRFAALGCLLLALGAGPGIAAPFAYITNFGSATVSVIDTASNTVIATVPVGTRPWGVAVNPVLRRVYVANNGSNSVSVIDTDTQAVVASIPVGFSPAGIAVSLDGARVYVTNNFDDVGVIDANTNSVTGSVLLPGNAFGAHGIAISPDGNLAVVANAASSTFTQIGLNDPARTATFTAPGGLTPSQVVISADGTRVYMTAVESCSLIAEPIGIVPIFPLLLGCPLGAFGLGIASNPVTGIIYVATANGVVTIRPSTGAANSFSGVASASVGIHPNGSRVYAGAAFSSNVYVIDAASGAVLATVPVGLNPRPFGTFVSPITSPSAPVIGAATAGNAQATIAFAVPVSNGGSAITGYTATCNAGAITASGAASPLVVTGLANGTVYACSVTAVNAIGTSAASATVNLTPATVPGAPALGGPAAGNAQATLTITAPAFDGGAAITSYSVVSNPPGGVDGGAGTTSTTRVVTGLSNGTPYTFTATATNAMGTSVASGPSSSVTPVGPPTAPAGAAATAGIAQATVTFVAPLSNGGSAITGYTVISNPAGGVDTNAGSTGTSHIVTGLTNGTAYTFTVTAANAIGASPPSAASTSVTPAGLPGAPNIGIATPGNGTATISFTAPASNGGSAIVNYAATCNPGAIGASATASPIAVAGLTNSAQYTCSVTATNGVGAGPASATTTVTPIHNTFSGTSATGSGNATVSFIGGGASCTFAPAGNGPLQSAFFIPVTGHPKSPPPGTAPSFAFPHGLLDFVLVNCTPGSTVNFTVTYPAVLDAATQYWKYGPTPSNATPAWYVLPATINGNSVSFSIVDGALGDDDLAANGTVVDQGGPGGGPGLGGVVQIPTLSEWALVALASLMMLVGMSRRGSLRRL